MVKSLDRLGRNYADIQAEWRDIVNKKKADIVILDMPILDTRTNKDLIGTLISDIVLQLLSYVAQVERDNLRQRQAEGIAIARAQGRHLGRYPKPIPAAFYPIFARWNRQDCTQEEAANTLGVTLSQFRTMTRKHRKALEISRNLQNEQAEVREDMNTTDKAGRGACEDGGETGEQ